MSFLAKVWLWSKKHGKALFGILAVIGLGILAFLYKRQGLNVERLKLESDLGVNKVEAEELEAWVRELDKQLEGNSADMADLNASLLEVDRQAAKIKAEVAAMGNDEKLAKFKKLGY